VLESVDTDHSGSITLKEFLTGFAVTTDGDSRERANLTFDLWDTDHSGTLSRNEVREGWLKGYYRALQSQKISGALTLTYVSIEMILPSVFGEGYAKIIQSIQPHFPELFRRFIKEFGATYETAIQVIGAEANKIVDKIFELADTNHDQILSRAEYIEVFSKPELGESLGKLTENLLEGKLLSEGMTMRVIDEWVKSIDK